MPPASDTITAVSLGIALSASAGFRVFIPMLGASIASLAGWIQLPAGMDWLGSWPALICFATAAVAEIGAYYIPFIDNLLDSIATPLAVAAGTLLAYSFFPLGHNTELIKWVIAFVTGGGSAGMVQAGTGLLRLFSTKTTAGTGNALLATGENTAALTTVSFSFIIPVIVAAIMFMLVLWIGVKLSGKLFYKGKP